MNKTICQHAVQAVLEKGNVVMSMEGSAVPVMHLASAKYSEFPNVTLMITGNGSYLCSCTMDVARALLRELASDTATNIVLDLQPFVTDPTYKNELRVKTLTEISHHYANLYSY